MLQVMMSTREPLEWHFKQLDQAVGLSFKANFHFALVGHLLKGYRHPTPTTVSRTARVLTMLLAIIAKPHRRDKFEVTPDSIAYLTGIKQRCLIYLIIFFSTTIFCCSTCGGVGGSEKSLSCQTLTSTIYFRINIAGKFCCRTAK